jgi:hypothetical protein
MFFFLFFYIFFYFFFYFIILLLASESLSRGQIQRNAFSRFSYEKFFLEFPCTPTFRLSLSQSEILLDFWRVRVATPTIQNFANVKNCKKQFLHAKNSFLNFWAFQDESVIRRNAFSRFSYEKFFFELPRTPTFRFVVFNTTYKMRSILFGDRTSQLFAKFCYLF